MLVFRKSLAEDSKKYFDAETGVLEAPVLIFVADQVKSTKSFKSMQGASSKCKENSIACDWRKKSVNSLLPFLSSSYKPLQESYISYFFLTDFKFAYSDFIV